MLTFEGIVRLTNLVLTVVSRFRVSLAFGLQGNTSLYEASNCKVVSASQSLSQLQCITGVGVGSSLYWTLSIAGQVASATAGPTSYGRPVLSAFSGTGADGGVTTGQQVRCCRGGTIHCTAAFAAFVDVFTSVLSTLGLRLRVFLYCRPLSSMGSILGH